MAFRLAGQEVGPIGFGMMGLTWRPTPFPREQSFEVMRAALQNGSTQAEIDPFDG